MATRNMAQRSKAGMRPTAATPTRATGLRSWTKERKIYLAVGILACVAGVLIMAFSG
ncbi:hypothetical protein [Arthrobacter sp. 92]|jgi:uncharacterized membrane protein HdeD (DUF308 family)|uniref:hypothetical protein n=1 Tax=Arthrobacter sp. 92 TaxID=3418175 RepID=UPI003CFE2DE0